MKQLFITNLTLILFIFCTAGYGVGSQDKKESSQGLTVTLSQAVAIALQNNRVLRRSELNVASRKIAVKAREAEFNIKVKPVTAVGYHSSTDEYWSAGLELSKKSTIGLSGSVTPQMQRYGDTYKSSIDISLNIPLLKGFGSEYTLDGLNSSLYDFENAKRSLYQQQVSIVLNTVSTVYEIIKSQKQIQLLSDQINVLEHHLSITKIKEKTRLASAMDLYRAEIRLKDVQNELTTVYEQLENHTDKLKSLLAVPMQGDMTVMAPVEYKPIDTKSDEAISIALENRIEIEQSQRGVEESKRKMILAKKNILPHLDLKMGYERYGYNSSFDLNEDNVTISLNSSSDLFRSDERRAFEQAGISLKQSRIDLESEKQKITREVRSQINHMMKKQKHIGDRREQMRQAEGKLALASSKFNHGFADNFNLLEAQSQTQQVQSYLLFDTIDYIVSLYRLRALLGTLIDRKVKK